MPEPDKDPNVDPVLERLREMGGDFVLPFQLEESGLRGRLVRLDDAAELILSRHGYPAAPSMLLGEAVALTAALSATVKFEGKFTLQAQSDQRAAGARPIRTLVADVDTGGHLRGYAAFDADEVAALPSDASPARMFGGGYLAFTVERGGGRGRYQGIVPLEGETLAESVHHYFRQSEQIPTGLRLACAQDADGRWRAAALLVQRVPDTGGEAIAGGQDALPRPDPETWEEDEGYMRAMALLATLTDAELLSTDLAPESLLYRLFHEDGVRVWDASQLTGHCACPADKFDDLLTRLPRDEVEACKIDGIVSVTCEFCGKTEHFDDAALERIFEAQASP